jgi:hypothetical protein
MKDIFEINNKEDYDKFYPYSKYKPNKYPKKYPCICTKDYETIGIMGDCWRINVYYLPDINDPISMAKCFLGKPNESFQE